MEPFQDVASQYREFAVQAADSPTFADWSARIAADAAVQAWIGALPPAQQQPNLVLAAARRHGVPAPGPYAALRDALLGDDGTIRATILSRSTQTNETGRLATLVPALSLVAAEHDGAPLSLLEVGASAGLCLYPDRYAYCWHTADGDRFDAAVRELVRDGACHWVSNEAPRVLPSVTATAPEAAPDPTFVLGIDGRAVAWTHGHGRSLRWFG